MRDESACGRLSDDLADALWRGLLPDAAVRAGEVRHVAGVLQLGEARGGGYTSASAVLFDRSVFGAPVFPSSATMVNDSLSCHVALQVLAHLRRIQPTLQASAAEFETVPPLLDVVFARDYADLHASHYATPNDSPHRIVAALSLPV